MNNQFISCLPSTSTAAYTKPEQAASTSSLPEIPPQNQDFPQHKQPSNNNSEMSGDEQSESLQNEKLRKCRVLNINNDEANSLRILPRPISPDVVILQHGDQELSDDDAPRNSLPEIPHIGQEASGHPLAHSEITTSHILVREVLDASKKAVNELVGTSHMKFDTQVEIDKTLNFMPLSSGKLENCTMLNRKHNEEDAVRPLSPDERILPSISPSHKDQKLSDNECMQEDVLKVKPNIDEDMRRDIIEAFQGRDQDDQPMENQRENPNIVDLQCAVMRSPKTGVSPFPEPDENGSFGRLSPIKRAQYFQRIFLTVIHSTYCIETICWIAGCAIMKITLCHFRKCPIMDGSCSVSYCSTVRWIIRHYEECAQDNCLYCMLTNEADAVVCVGHPLRQVIIRLMLLRLSFGENPVCEVLSNIPTYTLDVCRKHRLHKSRPSPRSEEPYDYAQQVTTSKRRDQTLYNFCNRRYNNWDAAREKLNEMECDILCLIIRLHTSTSKLNGVCTKLQEILKIEVSKRFVFASCDCFKTPGHQ